MIVCRGVGEGSFRAELWHEYLGEWRCHLWRRLTLEEEPLGKGMLKIKEWVFKHVTFEIFKLIFQVGCHLYPSEVTKRNAGWKYKCGGCSFRDAFKDMGVDERT